MSACISSRGEFGSHNIPVGESFCEDCGYLDEDAVMAERDALREAIASIEELAKVQATSCRIMHRADHERNWLDVLAIIERAKAAS